MKGGKEGGGWRGESERGEGEREEGEKGEGGRRERRGEGGGGVGQDAPMREGV